ncbi:ATP-binding protein [Streptomyces sp. NPDC046881]|uniref:ATP-binding protein n=1 Tax=Streptomyces sp. NPDC046881 TaxID=3155374 RepID=UPI0033E8F7CE
MPAPVYALGLATLTVHAWSAFSQAMIDAGWYNPDAQPPTTLVRLRPLIPFGLSAGWFVLFAWPLYVEGDPVPVGFLGSGLLAGSFLLPLPYALAFEVMLRAAVGTCQVEVAAKRRDDASTVHSLVKNAMHALVRQIQQDRSAEAETRALVRELGFVVEEARLAVLDQPTPPQSLPVLMDRLRKIVPRDHRQDVELDPVSARLKLGRTDYGLVRRVLPDLITNAWKAGAQHVDVVIRIEQGEPRSWVAVRVADDGPGVPTGFLSRPDSSLQVLEHHLRRFEGTMQHESRPCGGTSVSVRWRSSVQ